MVDARRGADSPELEADPSESWISKTPLRISFGGGGTDFEPYYRRQRGFVVSATIDSLIRGELRFGGAPNVRIECPGIGSSEFDPTNEEIHSSDPLSYTKSILRHFSDSVSGTCLKVTSDLAMGTGLGSSGSMGVNLVGLLCRAGGDELSPQEVAERAFLIEHDELGRSTGRQDHYAASFGGINKIHFHRGGIEVEPVELNPEDRAKLERSIMLFDTGISRDSSAIVGVQERSVKCRNRSVLKRLDRILELGLETAQLLEEGDLAGFGSLMHCSWLEKREVAGTISNSRIDQLYQIAREAGAIGGKICGAGGGGMLMLFVPENRQSGVNQELSHLGANEVPFTFETHGLRIDHPRSQPSFCTRRKRR